MPWYFYLALKQLFPSGRRFPFFTAISVLSVALGVALLIVVLSVMGGFGSGIRQLTVDTQGEVQVRARGFINDPAAVQKIIAKFPEVKATTPFAEGVVMMQYERKPVFPTIQGIDVDHVAEVIPIERFIRVGSLNDLDDDSVIVSAQLAMSLGLHIGDKVLIYSPLLLDKVQKEEAVLPKELKVVGLFEIGHQQLDSSTIIVTLRLMQELYGLNGAVHGINIKLIPGADADLVATKLTNALPEGMRARSWSEINGDFLWIVQLEKNIMTFIMLFVVLVAAFLTMSLLLVLVLKKTREIGLLGALGASRGQIALCFCCQGVGIGIVGTALGLVLGFTFLHFRNDVVALITRFTGSRELLARFYQFNELPAHTQTSDLVLIVISAIVLSTLAGVVPALMAARLKPVEALRSE